MSHFVKKLTLIALAMIVLWSMSAFAQNTNNIPLVAKADKASKPAKASAAPAKHSTPTSSSQNWVTHRFEISFQGGGVAGGSLGKPDIGSCKSGLVDGCNTDLNLHHDNPGQYGIYPGTMGGLKYFQRNGGIQPGNGGVWGMRLGFNLTSKWQLEFVYNHAQTGTSFTNKGLLDQNYAEFQGNGFPGSGIRNLFFVNNFDGRPHGDQNQYLFNLNRNFNAGGRIVPYIGGGIGAVSWSGGPRLNFIAATNEPATAQFTKDSSSATGFAYDFQAGAKAYLTPNFGVRGDVTDVMSFPSISNRSRAFDVSNLQGFGTNGIFPISGDTHQSGRFNQLMFTGGVFWAFGGAWQPDRSSGFASSGDDFWDHWELSFDFGGAHGSSNGYHASKCTPSVTAGCAFTDQNFLTQGNLNGGVYPGKIANSLPNFLATGGLKPGDGWATGLRLGCNFTPNWELELIWQGTGTATALTNKSELDTAQIAFDTGDINSTFPRTYNYLNGANGEPRGNQSMFLFNLDRNFHVSRRFVPYIGAGLGWENWNDNPRVNVRTDTTGTSSEPNVADFVKSTRGQRSFALDLSGGAKYYLARHWGVRFDVTDVMSFNNFRTDFDSIDTSGLYGTPGASTPVAGRLTQDVRFNQLISTAGVFWSFGQGGTWKSSSATEAGTGPHAGRFELSFQTGGVVGGNIGEERRGKCTSTADNGDGCDVNQNLTHSGSLPTVIYPGKLAPLAVFQRYSGVEPGNGGLYGLRLGYNITPAWELEFIWNHAQTSTSFDRLQLVQDAVTDTNNPRFNSTNRNADYVGGQNGAPQGNQNMYLVNLDRNFNVSGRIVPYVGFGMGAESWYGGPKLNIYETDDNNDQVAQFTKFSGNSTAFALDFATGAKIYVTKSFGVRADFTDVISFPGIDSRAQAIDISNFTGLGAGSTVPITNRLQQDGRFNQAVFSAGVFWSLGGRMNTAGHAAPTGDRESVNDHWELSFNFGGTHGGAWGPGGTSCTSPITGGCDLNQNFGHRATAGGTFPGNSVYPGRIAGVLPNFIAQGGIKPGDGYTTGFQIGYNLSPSWQLSFIWNALGTGTRFDNEHLLTSAQAAFYSGCDCINATTSERSFNYLNGHDGGPRGEQQQFLFNLNRNFRTNSRIVPYFGAGGGMELWNNNPNAAVETVTRITVLGLNNTVADFTKHAGGQAGFALDLAGGFKFYVSRHWGFRADMLNVTSFQEFSLKFASIDVSGQRGTPGALLPASGTLKQSTRFNQTSGTGGVFFTF